MPGSFLGTRQSDPNAQGIRPKGVAYDDNRIGDDKIKKCR